MGGAGASRSGHLHAGRRQRLAGFLEIPAHAKKTVWIRTRDGRLAQIPMGPLAHDPTVRARVLERINADPRLSSGTKALLNDLGSHSDDHNKSVYGSQTHYAERAGCVRKTIYNRTRLAEKAGYLKVARCKPFRHIGPDGKASYGRKWTNRYWLVIFIEDFPKYKRYFEGFLSPRPPAGPPPVPAAPESSPGAPEMPADGSLPVRGNAPPAEAVETSSDELPAAGPAEVFAKARSLRARPS